MDLSFLTPEFFNTIIVINLVVGVVLVVGRFTSDLRRSQPRHTSSFTDSLEDTQPTRAADPAHTGGSPHAGHYPAARTD